MARRQSASARVAPVEPGLRLHAEGERYSTLLKERERLLRSIGTKKQKLEHALNESREARQAVLERLQPLLIQFEAATAKLRALFEELLIPGRYSDRAVQQIAQVRRTLAGFGFLGSLDEDEPSDPEGWDDRPEREEADPPRAGHSASGSVSERHEEREVRSAAQRGQGKDRESLRTVFRRLVAASHPDRAVNEADRELRTATMKQATQAYEAGDLARLLELEKAWRHGQSLPPGGSAEASCRELERIIRELRAQANQLQRELRAARQSGSLEPRDPAIAEALEEAEADLEQLEILRDFVTRFRDGKMSLSEFVRGPQAVSEDEVIEAALAELLGSRPSKGPQGPKPKRARGKRAKSTHAK
ncbi:MAG: hypothetical protein ABUL62_15190 [Myxococcales bacterium]